MRAKHKALTSSFGRSNAPVDVNYRLSCGISDLSVLKISPTVHYSSSAAIRLKRGDFHVMPDQAIVNSQAERLKGL